MLTLDPCIIFDFSQMSVQILKILCISLCFYFHCRLQYFARGVQVYIKHLRMALQGKSGTELKEEEVKCSAQLYIHLSYE